jgi:hypothetical protein
VVAAGATALALGAAACGDGRLSHGSLVRRADAICSAYHDDVRLLTRPTGYDAVVAYTERTLPLYQAAVKRIAALRPPTQDEQAVGDWLAADRRVAAALRRLRDAAMRHDLAATNAAAAAVQAAGSDSHAASRALGLRACAAP